MAAVMRSISKSMQIVFNRITKNLDAENPHRKIDNSDGAFMPLVVEWIGDIDGFPLFSLAHYGEQNGDAMRDPEMCFLMFEGKAYPYYIRNDYSGIERESVFFDTCRWNQVEQRDQASFANIWLKNILHQQEVNASWQPDDAVKK
jgi:hypothetical protein